MNILYKYRISLHPVYIYYLMIQKGGGLVEPPHPSPPSILSAAPAPVGGSSSPAWASSSARGRSGGSGRSKASRNGLKRCLKHLIYLINLFETWSSYIMFISMSILCPPYHLMIYISFHGTFTSSSYYFCSTILLLSLLLLLILQVIFVIQWFILCREAGRGARGAVGWCSSPAAARAAGSAAPRRCPAMSSGASSRPFHGFAWLGARRVRPACAPRKIADRVPPGDKPQALRPWCSQPHSAF